MKFLNYLPSYYISSVFNPEKFARTRDPADEFRVFMFSRLSSTKGITEYVEASRILRERGEDIEFHLAGRFDQDEYAITPDQIEEWGAIEFSSPKSQRTHRTVSLGQDPTLSASFARSPQRCLHRAGGMGR